MNGYSGMFHVFDDYKIAQPGFFYQPLRIPKAVKTYRHCKGKATLPNFLNIPEAKFKQPALLTSGAYEFRTFL